MIHDSSGRTKSRAAKSNPRRGRLARTDSVSLALRQLWSAEIEPVPDSFLRLLDELDAAHEDQDAAHEGRSETEKGVVA